MCVMFMQLEMPRLYKTRRQEYTLLAHNGMLQSCKDV